jgi:crotonobetainyl-CoA:carnitine CoA-transferase CaiB-like acyl-CoA transferase
MMGTAMSGPLRGITVVDVSRVMAAPFSTQVLGDFGATIIKVEALGGDDTRTWGSHYFRAANRGKQSIAVNLKDARGQRIVSTLAADADVFVENFKVGDLARYGLDYQRLRLVNERLIYLSVTGFGQSGPRQAQPGYDTIMQAMTGIMSLCGESDRPPARAGLPIVDVMSGLIGVIGILTALYDRQSTGTGQHIDLALFDVGIMALVDAGQDYLDHNHVQTRLGGINRNFAPGQPHQTKDGWVSIAVATDDQFSRMCAAMSLPNLLQDDRFSDNARRVINRQPLAELMAEKFITQPSAHWARKFEEYKVPLSPIFNIAEALADAQSSARRVVWNLHSASGPLRLLANPLQHMSRSPATPAGPPPALGEHTAEILRSRLKFDDAEVAALIRDGVVRIHEGR